MLRDLSCTKLSIPQVVNLHFAPLFQIYIARMSKAKCLRVRAWDRVGVYIEEAPGAIAYTFDPTPPYLLGGVFESLVSNQTVSFKSTLPFPYALSLSVYLDTNMSLYSVTGGAFPDCPKKLTIPNGTDIYRRIFVYNVYRFTRVAATLVYVYIFKFYQKDEVFRLTALSTLLHIICHTLYIYIIYM